MLVIVLIALEVKIAGFDMEGTEQVEEQQAGINYTLPPTRFNQKSARPSILSNNSTHPPISAKSTGRQPASDSDSILFVQAEQTHK